MGLGETLDYCRRTTDLHVIGYHPCVHDNDTKVDNCDGIDRIPIMKLALEEINERCDLLPGYRLAVDYNSSVSYSYNSMTNTYVWHADNCVLVCMQYNWS